MYLLNTTPDIQAQNAGKNKRTANYYQNTTNSKKNSSSNKALVSEKLNAQNDSIYSKVDTLPMFPGGLLMLITYLNENIKYPSRAKINGVQGVVLINFVVELDGSITNIRVISKEIGFGCEKEAIRAIKNMPLWTPGKYQGSPVRVSYNLPIRFMQNKTH